MTYAPQRPLDVPPYQLQSLVSGFTDTLSRNPVTVRCAQAIGSEIYVGCSNGELLRFALQGNATDITDAYTLLSRQTIPNEKPIDEIVLAPSISRALVLSGHQIHFYTLPTLDMVSLNLIKPIRNVVAFAVDELHMKRPPQYANDIPVPVEPIEFCVVKRSAIALYSLRERLFFQKEIPLPSGGLHARRTGKFLCVADRENYNVIDLVQASLVPLLPISQAMDSTVVVKPSITVISENEFLILSWTGASTIGVFITGEGDPVRGTLEWPSHPEAVSLDYPYVTTLLPNGTVEIHSVESQAIVQVISAPPEGPSPLSGDRKALIACMNGFFIPSTQRTEKLRPTPVRLLRGRGTPKPEPSAREDADADNIPDIPAF
ncbi:uncharacterized protein TRAVEDRAFT_131331 [Trametes versicolor FP-101664 SS1]|uniref:uncharacterized protein n=1 Tax=Trametes versicolor (strain FP-101664) TaxID=717944 RepID=UPI000462304E|nr:uncharacterized protein TRAVEDRAFT_131331 [Trametes versicolor FP-101664 SS1]EIW54796.1 hypothetical protein TRAVEDRAFT_131331 [Trametes versicolor FP-101664 SS1]